MTRTARNDSNSPSLKKLRIPPSQYWVVIEASKSKIIAPRKLVNSATASITGCALAAIAAGMPATGNQYLAITGEIDYPDDRIPESVEDELTSRLRRLLSSAADDGTGIPTYSLETQDYSIRLRLFEDSATAEDWVHTLIGGHESTVRGRLSTNFAEATKKLKEATKEMVSTLPSGYAARVASMTHAHKQFRSVLATSFETALNAKVATLPKRTYDEKKEVAKWVNAELRGLGLALDSGRSEYPCYLIGNPGGAPGFGRFVFEYTDETGKRHHPLTAVTLPPLKLMPDDLSRGAYQKTAKQLRR